MKIFNSASDNYLKDSFLFFDTGTLITIVENQKDFSIFLDNLKKINCAFLTIPSVAFEFSRTDNISKFKERNVLLSNFTIYPIEKQFKDIKTDLIYILQKLSSTSSYTDFLLHYCLMVFKNRGYVITGDHKDFSISILNRTSIITLESEKEIKNLAIYQISIEKYEKASKNILKHI